MPLICTLIARWRTSFYIVTCLEHEVSHLGLYLYIFFCPIYFFAYGWKPRQSAADSAKFFFEEPTDGGGNQISFSGYFF